MLSPGRLSGVPAAAPSGDVSDNGAHQGVTDETAGLEPGRGICGNLHLIMGHDYSESAKPLALSRAVSEIPNTPSLELNQNANCAIIDLWILADSFVLSDS